MSVNIARALKSHSKQRLFIIYCYLTQDSQSLFSIETLPPCPLPQRTATNILVSCGE